MLYPPSHLPVPWQKSFAMITHVSGALSVFGSSFILLEVFRDKKKRARVYHRLLLGMSTYDFFSSIWICLSSWPMPSGSWYGAVGNQRSCRMQGMFVAIGVGIPIYNAALALYFLLQVKYSWKDDKISKRVEMWAHVWAGSVAVSTAVAKLFLKMYHPSEVSWCTQVYPNGCDQQKFKGCQHPSKAVYTIFYIIGYGNVWLCAFFTGACMFALYKWVRLLERRSRRYTFPRSKSTEEKAKKSRQVAVMGILYMSVFFLTWVVPSVGAALMQLPEGATAQVKRALAAIAVTLYPVQGFLNFLIYTRPRFLNFAKQHPEWSMRQVLGKVSRRALNRQNTSDDDVKLGNLPPAGNVPNDDYELGNLPPAGNVSDDDCKLGNLPPAKNVPDDDDEVEISC